ncbi:MAG: ABC transporter permease [Candidatus Hodarchaeota archaeon]
MKLFNVWTVTKKNLNQMKRDVRMIGLSIFAPILVTALFGSVFGGELTNIKVIVINNDNNFEDNIATQISDIVALDPKIQYNITFDPNTARNAVTNNYSQAAIIFPSLFTENLLLGKETQIELYVSYENPDLAQYIISLFQLSYTQVLETYTGGFNFSVLIFPVHEGAPGPLPEFINISLCNNDIGWTKGMLSDKILDVLDENGKLKLIFSNDLNKSKSLVKKGEIRAILIFSENFTYEMLTKKEINLQVILDGAEPQSCLVIMSVLSSSLVKAFSEEFNKSNFNIDEYYFNNPDSTEKPIKSISYFTPAILCFIVFFFSFLLTMLAFLRERNQGTMERILTSPLTRGEVILGYILSHSILSIVQATSVILTTFLIFGAQIEYTVLSLIQAYLIIYLVVIGALGIGIFLSTLAKTEFQILQFIPLVIIPFMLLSGVWAPIETLPDWLQPVSQFIPLTYANLAMRDILLRKESFLDVPFALIVLLFFAVLMIALGTVKLNKKLK